MRFGDAEQIVTIAWAKHAQLVGAWLAPRQLPNIRGFWHASSYNPTGGKLTNDAPCYRDTHDLAHQGSPVVSIATSWPGVLAPYIDMDGSTDYFSVADTAGLSITGDMTIGLWAYANATAAAGDGLVSKYLTTDDHRSYRIIIAAGPTIRFAVSQDGSNGTEQTVDADTISANSWYFVCARFDAGTELSIRTNNGAWVDETSSVPASCNDNARAFQIGISNEDTGTLWDGRIAQVWICAHYLSDAMVEWVYQLQAPLFGAAQ